MIPAGMQVWAVDFEFSVPLGDHVVPRCMVAIEARSGRRLRLWEGDLHARTSAPFPVGDGAVMVAYAASAELSCFLALGWPMPALVLDLYIEFLARTNGIERPQGKSLLAALAYFGLSGIDASEKQAWRDIVLRGGPCTAEEQEGILDYCESDVRALLTLLPYLEP